MQTETDDNGKIQLVTVVRDLAEKISVERTNKLCRAPTTSDLAENSTVTEEFS